jgi:hypothetical protein
MIQIHQRGPFGTRPLAFNVGSVSLDCPSALDRLAVGLESLARVLADWVVGVEMEARQINGVVVKRHQAGNFFYGHII